MKKRNYFAALLLSAAGLASCSDINEMQQEYLDRGEKIYAGKIDSLVVRGGHYRVEISGLMRYAQTAEKCIIRWETDSLTTDSLIVSLAGLTVRDTLKVIVDNLMEGGRLFYVQTYDREGNKSLNESCYGYVYGEQYILSSASKIIVSMRPEPAGIELTWNKSDEAIGVALEYDSNEGVKTLSLPGNVDTLFLTDWKIGGEIRNRTKLLPEAGAIDTLYSEWLTQTFPAHVEYALTKNKITPLNHPFDATTGHGGQRSGVFDDRNDTDHQFHSGDGVDVPLHLTFDLGVRTTLTRYEWWARDDGYNNWNPLTMQLWGIDDLSGAQIMIPSKDANWEDEAIALGWTLLTENTITGNGIYSNSQIIQTQKKIRYLIVRVTRVFAGSGGGTYAIIREMNLYANSISPIE
jgi:hypothetical protein